MAILGRCPTGVAVKAIKLPLAIVKRSSAGRVRTSRNHDQTSRKIKGVVECDQLSVLTGFWFALNHVPLDSTLNGMTGQTLRFQTVEKGAAQVGVARSCSHDRKLPASNGPRRSERVSSRGAAPSDGTGRPNRARRLSRLG